jgi:chromosome segregation ATPase
MSKHVLAVGRAPRLVRFAAAAGLLLAATAGLARADTASSAPPASGPDAVAPVEEFSKQLDQLKKSFADLNKRIEQSAKTIDNATDPVASRKELDELRAIVSALLGSVADNGEVAQLGAKALEHARAKEKSLRDETRFTSEQREFLLHQWEKLARDTQAATAELDDARTRFAKVLRTLQTNDDYIGELMEIRQGDEALKVVRDLAKQIHEASDMLNNFINSLTPPQPGT